MEDSAIDLHKKESQIQILTESGEVSEYRIATTRERGNCQVAGTHSFLRTMLRLSWDAS